MRYRFMRYPGGKPKAVTFSYDDGFWFDVNGKTYSIEPNETLIID